MSFSEYVSPLIGRLVLAWFYLSEGLRYVSQWDATIQLMALKHMPAAPLLLALTVIVLILGGLSLIVGFQTRHGATLLFGFTILASVAMHNFWVIHNPIERASDFELFARNMALAGALLILVGMGPGPIAIDTIEPKKKR
jgi:putative oxidoreductase